MNSLPRKKVLFLITKSNFGGAQRYVYDIATHLNQSEFEPIVALGGDGPIKSMLEHGHIRVIPIPSLERDISLKKEFLALLDVIKILHKEKPFALHVNSSKAGGIGTLAGRITRVPNIIFTAHGWAFNEDRPWWQKILIKALHWVTILFSHTTVVVSTGTYKQMNWPLVQKKMLVVHPGRTIGVMYNKTEARNEIISRIPEIHSNRNDLWLGTIAELHPIKRHDLSIRAFGEIAKQIPRARYIIIGGGSEEESLRNLIKKLDLENQVYLAGNIQEAARFLKAFDVFLLASRSEAYPYVITEAGLAKVPVIASDVGGIRDAITPGESGLLFESGSVRACTFALKQLITDKALQKKFSDALYETVSVRTVEKMTGDMSVLYRKTL